MYVVESVTCGDLNLYYTRRVRVYIMPVSEKTCPVYSLRKANGRRSIACDRSDGCLLIGVCVAVRVTLVTWIAWARITVRIARIARGWRVMMVA